ncbi:MAG: glycine cleavage system aminomethyltransferase GcvT [Pirellulaceae bacterium]|nr:glycine cleavage system aminomethyltransferase GcvT [Pirellulaceae bacterium]
MSSDLAQTPLHAWHLKHAARMVDFAGWSMPVQYVSIVREHVATRERCTLFDVSHMGRLRFEGEDACRFLDRLLTRRVSDLAVGRVRYSLMTNESGGVLDDVLISHLESPNGQRYYLLVVNAGNREKILGWIGQHLAAGWDVRMFDRTAETAMIAVQGPRALQAVAPLLDIAPGSLKYYTAAVTRSLGRVCIVSRTGYTGEDGCELIVRAEDAVDVCNNLLRAGRELGIEPAGLGCRDTLRLEAGMPLYGHELNETLDPYQAGLGFAVNLEDRDFIGREALAALSEAGGRPVRVGLEIEGRRPAREGYAVCAAAEPGAAAVGSVTSGTLSPSLQKPIAMALVEPALSAVGTRLAVDIRGQLVPAQVVKLPFYVRSR